ncbi:hypothetical protein AKJ50_00930 [candidate division MSBL1 archaeon SCGC-AAA382A13]|uniref:Saccharopine dehydrogenase n=1 Tax=candidate division MSBL1 archaeon SCGC-AAA382A13 TaxID=1698279 RepID=A0A133VGA1_9EURY|nr:hypothetical protein AKJ50_00930 [candidate division MSBL1 archaeon SCGC-AAA382A13]
MNRKALIIGAGAQGSVIATNLAECSYVSEIVLSDIYLEKAKKTANRLNNEKIFTSKVDANDVKDIKKASKEMDLVINATTWNPEFNLNIMEACKENNAHYQDMASEPCRQLKLDDEWKKTGLTALIDTGIAPGFSNVLVAEGADKFGSVDEVRIRLYAEGETEKPVSLWSPETAWEDMVRETIMYIDGDFKDVPPFSGEETYEFPDLGPKTVYYHSHEEPKTLPKFIDKGLNYLDFKMGGTEFPIAKAFYEFGLFGEEPIDVKGVKVAPRDVLLELVPPTPSMEEIEEMVKNREISFKGCLLVEVKGEIKGKEKRYIRYLQPPTIEQISKIMPGANPVAYGTSMPASMFARLILKGKIKTRGVIPPEALESKVRKEFLEKLEDKYMGTEEKIEDL